MLTKVEIKNYRGFPSYRMERLAQVNLLVGKNNSGKTALLEAIQFLVSGGDTDVLYDTAQRRGESVVISRRTDWVDISHFFHRHRLDLDTSFEIAGDNGFPPVQVKIVAGPARQMTFDGGTIQSGEPIALLKIRTGETAEGVDIAFERGHGSGVDLRRSSSRGRTFSGKGSTFPAAFIGTDGTKTATLAALWDEIQLNGLEDEVRDALRVLEPETVSVHFLSGMINDPYSPSKAGIVVGLANKQRVPLGSMGDGMRRMLALAASLACVRNGALFADEIDTGLHYSVMSDMWKLVISRAVAANTQVFATTHSWDCIEGLSLLCQREPQWQDQVAVHTIDRTLQHSVAFVGESVARMAKHQIDPR